MKIVLRLFLSLVVLWSVHARAAEFIDPAPDLTPQEVVEIQLLGLQSAGQDRQSGIEQVWRFAHPDNRKVTGPLLRFSTLFDLPAYAPLIGFQDYVINDSRQTESQARFVITIRARDGAAYGYVWVLRPAVQNTDGAVQKLWMTTAVSAPSAGGAS
jgi:hypothetical protein